MSFSQAHPKVISYDRKPQDLLKVIHSDAMRSTKIGKKVNAMKPKQKEKLREQREEKIS